MCSSFVLDLHWLTCSGLPTFKWGGMLADEYAVRMRFQRITKAGSGGSGRVTGDEATFRGSLLLQIIGKKESEMHFEQLGCEDDLPQWTCASEVQEPRINTTLMIDMVTRKNSHIIALEEDFCADRTAEWLMACSWLFPVVRGICL